MLTAAPATSLRHTLIHSPSCEFGVCVCVWVCDALWIIEIHEREENRKCNSWIGLPRVRLLLGYLLGSVRVRLYLESCLAILDPLSGFPSAVWVRKYSNAKAGPMVSTLDWSLHPLGCTDWKQMLTYQRFRYHVMLFQVGQWIVVHSDLVSLCTVNRANISSFKNFKHGLQIWPLGSSS